MRTVYVAGKSLSMLIKSSIFLPLIAVSCLLVGCASRQSTGAEQKLGRGINNMGEVIRFGELRRSIEQSAIFGSPDQSRAVGIIHGFNRSMARTGVGLYEVLTFPIPNHSPHDYGPVLGMGDPTYPDSYRPSWGVTSTLSPNASLGFSGGDEAPLIPGSRFRVFDN